MIAVLAGELAAAVRAYDDALSIAGDHAMLEGAPIQRFISVPELDDLYEAMIAALERLESALRAAV